MIYTLDKELKGHAMVFSGPLDLMNETVDAYKGIPEYRPGTVTPNAYDKGRKGNGWDALRGFIKTPWPEATSVIDGLIQIIKATLPPPESINRHKVWSDTDGELSIDRVMRGESDAWQQTTRKRKVGPTQIALLCNLDYAPSIGDIGVFWRSAAAIAATDLLEAAGYTVELWMWCLGRSVYPRPYDKQFTTCCLKAAGAPVDIDLLCDTMSRWFTSKAIFGSFQTCPVKPTSIGSMYFVLGEWRKYMDVTPNVREVHAPIVWGETATIAAAHKIVKEATEDIPTSEQSGPWKQAQDKDYYDD